MQQNLRRILARANDGPADRQQHHSGADVECEPHRVRNGLTHVTHSSARQNPRQHARYNRTHADEEALNGIPGGPLPRAELIAHQRPERLHGNIDGAIEQPQQRPGKPQCWRARHENQRGRGQDGSDEKIRPAPAQARPRAVGHVADDRLHQQSTQWRGNPQQRHLVQAGTEGLENAADIGILQTKGELHAEEAEAHVPDLPE